MEEDEVDDEEEAAGACFNCKGFATALHFAKAAAAVNPVFLLEEEEIKEEDGGTYPPTLPLTAFSNLLNRSSSKSLYLTSYLIFSLLNDEKLTSTSLLNFKTFLISAMTVLVAVAVQAIQGTVGNVVRSHDNLL